MNEKIFATPYGEIHYWVKCADADSPWLIYLPGLTADHHLFDKQIDDLGGKYNCFTWDSPAHGLSRPFLLQFSLEDIANYLHDILEKESIRTQMIGLALQECKKLGIDKVLMVCDKENVGSAKSIMNNGGVLENEVVVDGVVEQRYWITLD